MCTIVIDFHLKPNLPHQITTDRLQKIPATTDDGSKSRMFLTSAMVWDQLYSDYFICQGHPLITFSVIRFSDERSKKRKAAGLMYATFCEPFPDSLSYL